jgi:hypothetical protein
MTLRGDAFAAMYYMAEHMDKRIRRSQFCSEFGWKTDYVDRVLSQARPLAYERALDVTYNLADGGAWVMTKTKVESVARGLFRNTMRAQVPSLVGTWRQASYIGRTTDDPDVRAAADRLKEAVDSAIREIEEAAASLWMSVYLRTKSD